MHPSTSFEERVMEERNREADQQHEKMSSNADSSQKEAQSSTRLGKEYPAGLAPQPEGSNQTVSSDSMDNNQSEELPHHKRRDSSGAAIGLTPLWQAHGVQHPIRDHDVERSAVDL